MPTDPKAILGKAEKLIASAKNALAQTERIQRRADQLQAERKKLIASADPENRATVKPLVEVNTEIELLPHYTATATTKQTEAGLALSEVSEELRLAINWLYTEECERELDKWEAVLLPACPNHVEANGSITRKAQAIAKQLGVFEHMRQRSTPSSSTIVLDPSRLHNDPLQALPAAIAFVEEQHLILAEYFSNRKSFVAPGFGKAEQSA